MRKPIILIAFSIIAFLCGCDKSSSYVYDHSLSICPIQAIASLDYSNRVDYKLSGYNIHSYSSCTICFRRVTSSGREKSYSEIIDTRENPNTYQTYHTYKKLSYDEVGVKVKWIELTTANTGKTDKYINYH